MLAVGANADGGREVLGLDVASVSGLSGPSALPSLAERRERWVMKTTVAGADVGSPGTDQGCFAGVLLGLEVGLCVGAAGGAYHLITTSHTAMPVDVLARTPFPSWTIPGYLLALCVALPAGVVAFGTATRRAYAHVGHPLLGLT
jgi:hypothetical protein